MAAYECVFSTDSWEAMKAHARDEHGQLLTDESR